MFSQLESAEINEAFLTWKDKQPNYVSRNELLNINSNIIAVLKYPGGQIVPHFTANLVVNTGEEYYVQLIGQVTPTNTFDTMFLGNPVGNDTILATDNFSNLGTGTLGGGTTQKAIDATYPKNNDDDTANPGRGEFVHTWRTSYLTTDFNTDGQNNIRTGVIVISTATGTDPILNHWNFTSNFAKLVTASLVVWVNHSLVGV